MRINTRLLSLFVLPAALAVFSPAVYLCAGEGCAEASDNYYNNAKVYTQTPQAQGRWLSGQDMEPGQYQPVTYFPGQAGQGNTSDSALPAGYNYEDSCKDCQKTWTG